MSSRNLLVGPLLHLRTLHAFEGLSPRHLTALAQEVDEVYVERGTVLLSPSQPAQGLHVVVDGLVSLRREGIEAPAGPGASVGFLELLAQGPSGTDARTQVDTVALRLDGDGLREVCERHFAILDALLANVARRAAEIPSALHAVVAGDPGAWTTPLASPLDRVARLRALHRAPAFPSASMDALSEMASHMKEVRLEAGEALWEVGTPADAFLVLCEGTVRYTSQRGDWSVDVGPGGVPGLPATLARGRRSMEARARTPVVALRMESEPFLDVLEDHFEMAFELLGRLARCVLSADAPLGATGSETPGARG